MSEWKKRCAEEWSLQGAPMPDSQDWKSVYEAKPLGRNLLKNPSPHGSRATLETRLSSSRASVVLIQRKDPLTEPPTGVSKDTPPPEPDLPEVPRHGPPCFQPDGDFSSWTTSTEILPYDSSGIPAGAVVCQLPQYSWFTMEQVVDLKAEGLWEELLDNFQPEIFIQDWYEESQLHESIFELHVKLLGADKSTVISEHSANPTEDRSAYSHTWKGVSHVFSGYGPGVRYVHFQHRLKNQYLNGFYGTLSSDSSVMVRPTKTSA